MPLTSAAALVAGVTFQMYWFRDAIDLSSGLTIAGLSLVPALPSHATENDRENAAEAVRQPYFCIVRL